MRYLIVVLLPLLVTACQESPDVISNANAATAKSSGSGAIVVELYQSQGCSSCPPANLALNRVADRSDLIALNFSVTYWDRLGWKDTFGDKSYTDRQHGYAKAFRSRNVYTPQMVLNGRTAIVGNGRGELNQAIRSMKPISGGPSINTSNNRVTIGKGNGRADVWLVRYDPRTQVVAIRAGENNGRKLPHKNIVRQLVKLGRWTGTASSYRLPPKPSKFFRSAILVQRPGHREIISAKKL